MSSRANNTFIVSVDSRKLVGALKQKRETEGLSLRKLSSIIGVSFSTLARIERGDGEPDNNSLLRILDWLGEDGQQAGLTFENVALVHFRAAKNVTSKTTKCLLLVANLLKRQFQASTNNLAPDEGLKSNSSELEDKALALSKPEMEELALNLRIDVGVEEEKPLNALGLSIEGVDVLVPQDIKELDNECENCLINSGSDEWSAMSVPLDIANDKWAILRNDRHSIERQRVTYLEECWHILLGHKLTKIARIGEAYGRTYESSEEHDAFYLASASLLPEKAIKRAVSKGKSAIIIGQEFEVSPELVEYRIKRLGLWRKYKGLPIKIVDS